MNGAGLKIRPLRPAASFYPRIYRSQKWKILLTQALCSCWPPALPRGGGLFRSLSVSTHSTFAAAQFSLSYTVSS